MTERRPRKTCGAALAAGVACVLLMLPGAAGAGPRGDLVQDDLATVAAAPPAGARLPADVMLADERGTAKPLSQWTEGRPGVWLLADFTCQSLCSPVLRMTADALADSGLAPGRDYRLFVLGLDPKDSASDAAAMKAAQIGSAALSSHTTMLRASADGVAQVAAALGVRFRYDAAHDQFAHPAAVFVVDGRGRVARILAGLSLRPQDMRLALVEAGQGRIGTFADSVRLLCYGFDPAHGVYGAAIGRALAIGGAATIAALALLFGFMVRHERASGLHRAACRRRARAR